MILSPHFPRTKKTFAPLPPFFLSPQVEEVRESPPPYSPLFFNHVGPASPERPFFPSFFFSFFSLFFAARWRVNVESLWVPLPLFSGTVDRKVLLFSHWFRATFRNLFLLPFPSAFLKVSHFPFFPKVEDMGVSFPFF